MTTLQERLQRRAYNDETMRYVIPLLLILPLPAAAQSVPPRLGELLKQAANWPPEWAASARDLAATPDDFENIALERVAKLVQSKPSVEAYRLAETILSATLRHHLSLRRVPPLAENPWQATQIELQDRLALIRKDWLEHENDPAAALQLANLWLPVTPPDSPLRNAILQRWLAQASAAVAKKDYSAVRPWLLRLEANFNDSQTEAVRKPMRARAQGFLKESLSLPDPEAIRALEEALELWPRLPEARDALERRKGTYRTLVVGVPALPTLLSPATASTEVEVQSLALSVRCTLPGRDASAAGPALSSATGDGSSDRRRFDLDDFAAPRCLLVQRRTPHRR